MSVDILSALIVMPLGRKPTESFSIAAGIPRPTQRTVPASVNQPALLPRASKVIHGLVVPHNVLRQVDMGSDDGSQAAQRFLQTIPRRYPFFGPQNATNSSRTTYPALDRPQISHPDLFSDLDDTQSRNTEAMTSPGRPIDLASAQNTFDFVANIHQLHFQLPTVQ